MKTIKDKKGIKELLGDNGDYGIFSIFDNEFYSKLTVTEKCDMHNLIHTINKKAGGIIEVNTSGTLYDEIEKSFSTFEIKATFNKKNIGNDPISIYLGTLLKQIRFRYVLIEKITIE